jgi:hypothetical protein
MLIFKFSNTETTYLFYIIINSENELFDFFINFEIIKHYSIIHNSDFLILRKYGNCNDLKTKKIINNSVEMNYNRFLLITNFDSNFFDLINSSFYNDQLHF